LSPHSFSLSPAGDQLAYAVFASTSNIWAIDLPAQGTVSAADARPFTQGTQVIEGMALSPDGRWLAFDSDRNGNEDVYKVPVAGGETVQLTSDPDDDFVSTWSGDGRELAAQSAVARLLARRPPAGVHLRGLGAARAVRGGADGQRVVGRRDAADLARRLGGPLGARRPRDSVLPP
jgi:hypothetical protein